MLLDFVMGAGGNGLGSIMAQYLYRFILCRLSFRLAIILTFCMEGNNIG